MTLIVPQKSILLDIEHFANNVVVYGGWVWGRLAKLSRLENGLSQRFECHLRKP